MAERETDTAGLGAGDAGRRDETPRGAGGADSQAAVTVYFREPDADTIELCVFVREQREPYIYRVTPTAVGRLLRESAEIVTRRRR